MVAVLPIRASDIERIIEHSLRRVCRIKKHAMMPLDVPIWIRFLLQRSASKSRNSSRISCAARILQDNGPASGGWSRAISLARSAHVEIQASMVGAYISRLAGLIVTVLFALALTFAYEGIMVVNRLLWDRSPRTST